ncbi:MULTISPECIES: YkvA family protein [Vitreoscilla]|uniref:DUF1232 domain-containing protein n=1 Tax=Vitreoscilla stercoraria TaxID=61 RepID=A0ABY4E862_VITST|nr:MULTISPECIES: YkvA family protein [Vitreoscilla]AUZ04886.2 hypothetical protein ADP71_12460 [Vitreoscilla sp. C1]UOO91459.1 DUF1232 domain-containing protein [Vitreoscilla stercoraria]
MKRVNPSSGSEEDLQNFNEQRFLQKLARFAVTLGKPVIEQIYALYFMMLSPDTPMKSKLMIVGALLYFVSPMDAIPDLLGPLGFSDDVAVIALVFKQLKDGMSIDIKAKALEATEKLLKKVQS